MVPQAPEFHPGGHTVIHRSPHPPLPGFIPVPTMMPPPPRHMYSPVTGAGDMATQYMPQYQSSQVYGDVGKTCKNIPVSWELALFCLDIINAIIVLYKRNNKIVTISQSFSITQALC